MKNRNGIILLADNDRSFLDTRAEFLEGLGYQVLRAYSLEEARQCLDTAYFHLAVLDVRLINDDDEKDASGLDLARDPAYRSIPKLIVTNFPSVSSAREALRSTPETPAPALDFVDKHEGIDGLTQAVEKTLEFVHINRDLDIQGDPHSPLSFPHLVSLLNPNLANRDLIYRSDEFEDLIRQTFYEYKQIRLMKVLWHENRRLCLPVLARSAAGVTDAFILVCGDREVIAHERAQMKTLKPETLAGPELRSQSETLRFGANVYSLPGAEVETIQTYRELLLSGRERPLKSTLQSLMREVLKEWHLHGHKAEKDLDLMSLYRQQTGLQALPRAEVENRVNSLIQSVRTLKAIEIKSGRGEISFQFAQQELRSFPDPIAHVYEPLGGYAEPVVCRISPGRLSADNILVDGQMQTWLTDFSHADQVPQWWDFICLEAAIRFEVSQAPDLLAWQDFEECLLAPARLDGRLEKDAVIADLRTSVALIEEIRRQACSEAGPDTLPFNAGLLVWVVEAMTRYDQEGLYTQVDRQKAAHLLMAAAMLADRLGKKVNIQTQPGGLLQIDDEGRISIGDRHVTNLSGMGLKLLRYMADQKGKAVSCQAIVEKVYGETFDVHDRDQNQRIRQEIRRLREKIEPSPDHPRYIITVRDIGYRLQASGVAEGK